MKIHGKELTITNDGTGIYYDHILIMDNCGTRLLNEHTDWDYLVKRITNEPNFDPRIYHPNLRSK
jgi:hypothetical protein